MAQLLDAYSDVTPSHGPIDINDPVAHHHHNDEGPAPFLLNDSTIDPILNSFRDIPWLAWLQTCAIFFLLFLLIRQIWRWRTRFIAQRRRRIQSKTN